MICILYSLPLLSPFLFLSFSLSHPLPSPSLFLSSLSHTHFTCIVYSLLSPLLPFPLPFLPLVHTLRVLCILSSPHPPSPPHTHAGHTTTASCSVQGRERPPLKGDAQSDELLSTREVPTQRALGQGHSHTHTRATPSLQDTGRVWLRAAPWRTEGTTGESHSISPTVTSKGTGCGSPLCTARPVC